MTDREQAFEQWFAERYPDTTSVYSEFRGTPVRDLMREAMAAGREQGLREAKEVCEGKALASALAHVNTDEQAFHIKAEAARSCAAAIEQLRGQ